MNMCNHNISTNKIVHSLPLLSSSQLTLIQNKLPTLILIKKRQEERKITSHLTPITEIPIVGGKKRKVKSKK